MIDQAELRRQEYARRVNRVMDYVSENLSGDLRLDTLARVANFSPYHFHRIFKSIVGETLNDFIRRVRAERAADHLLHNPTMSITEIALRCGYSSPSAFAREFRQMYEMSASQFRAGEHEPMIRIRRAAGETYQTVVTGRAGSEMVFDVDVKRLPERHVAYVRHIGPYNEIERAFARLMRWAGPRNLLRFPQTLTLAIYHDNPDVTPVTKLRADACVTVPEPTPVSGEVGTMTVPGGLFAVAHVEIDVTQYSEAWDRLIGEWMPQSGYQPDDRLCYEVYRNNPEEHPAKKHIVDICEPVRPL
jgi:AraC family transcriptional regulator